MSVMLLCLELLFEFLGKEVEMIVVDYLLGVVDFMYCYDVYVFVYVFEGSIVMSLNGGKEVMFKVGDMFYEGFNDIYIVGCNVSVM